MAYRYQGNSNLELTDALEEDLHLCSSLKKAFLTIQRADFIPASFAHEAYNDRPLRIEEFGFNVSAPHMHAFCLMHLNLQPGHSFLDVGSGCGIVTALGGTLVGPTGTSHGIDILDTAIQLGSSSVKKLSDRGVPLATTTFEKRNVFLPDPANRKWDRIHVGATCPQKKKFMLYDLLNPGGILVVPIKTHLIIAQKDLHGFTHESKVLEVRYGDLILPTKQEIQEAEFLTSLRVHIPHSSFHQDFKSLFNNKFLSDIRFIVEGKTIYAHRSILACRSPYFYSFYSSGFKDSLSDAITVAEYSYLAYFEFIRFIYTDDCEITDISIAAQLIGIAEFYRSEKLKAMAEWKLSFSLSIDNACAILQLASQYRSIRLKEIAFEYIITNYHTIKDTRAFLKMEKEHVVEILSVAVQKLPQYSMQ